MVLMVVVEFHSFIEWVLQMIHHIRTPNVPNSYCSALKNILMYAQI